MRPDLSSTILSELENRFQELDRLGIDIDRVFLEDLGWTLWAEARERGLAADLAQSLRKATIGPVADILGVGRSEKRLTDLEPVQGPDPLPSGLGE